MTPRLLICGPWRYLRAGNRTPVTAMTKFTPLFVGGGVSQGAPRDGSASTGEIYASSRCSMRSFTGCPDLAVSSQLFPSSDCCSFEVRFEYATSVYALYQPNLQLLYGDSSFEQTLRRSSD